jgi:hypothetical protein
MAAIVLWTNVLNCLSCTHFDLFTSQENVSTAKNGNLSKFD